jgi:glutamyl/glutaminyl-tRNA synthetase
MEISHVIRGEEWLPSTPKHILLYKAFGWEIPHFAHLPLLLNADKSKLSKRQGDVAVEDYVHKGYLKEAIINFTALLGWNPGKGCEKEIFSKDELLEQFRIAQVHKSGAVFDLKKLDWLNAQYIKKMPISALYEKTLPYLEKKAFYTNATDSHRSLDHVIRALTIEQDRLERLDQVGDNYHYFYQQPEVSPESLRWKNMSEETVKEMLLKAVHFLEQLTEDNWIKREIVEEKFLDEAEDRRGEFLWPLRVALTGEKKSPPPYEVAWVLGKTESIARVKKALAL